MRECIDDELLAELLDGDVDDELRRDVEAHVDGCSRCHATLAAFGRAFATSRSDVDIAADEPSHTEPGVAADAPAMLRPDTVVGDRFRVRALVGTGGMGVVYRAHDPELGRDVALKLIRTGWFLGTKPGELRARLLREARAMARVRHANVVAIFDVGEHAGDVFLAADFIEGRTLGEWLASTERAWPDVLEVFLAAGAGLAAAHAAGIVHRDFKPANVLVDAGNVPYVTDFGLARAVDDETQSDSDPIGDVALADDHVTRTGTFVGTPAYAAPEQLRGTPSPASDQFSFCVALFEALYGRRPFAGERLVERMLAVESGRVSATGRTAVPRRLHAEIVRGLAADPSRRHPSMNALLAALRRAARGPMRRLAPFLGGVALVGAAALGYGVGGTEPPACVGFEGRLVGVWGPDAVAELQTSAAQSEAATESGRLVQSALDDYARQWIVTATTACERTLVRFEQSQASYDLQLRCLAERLESMRAVMDLVRTSGPELHRAVAPALALPPLARCERLDPAQEVAPRDEAAAQRVADAEAKLARAEVFARGGDPDQARALAHEASAAADAAEHGPTQARARLAIAARARTSTTPQSHEQALFDAATFAASVGADRTLAEALGMLAFVVGVDALRFDEGRRHGLLAQSLYERLDGSPDDPDVLNALGAIENKRDAPERALALLERALAVATDPATIHAVRVNIAVAQFQLGDNAAAMATMRGVYETAAATMGRLHPTTIDASMNLAVTYASVGDFDEAIPMFETALAAVDQRGSAEHRLRVTALHNLGMALVEVGRAEEAVPLLQEAVEVARAHPHEIDLRLDEVQSSLASALTAVGQVDRGIELYADAWKTRRALFDADTREVLLARGAWARAVAKAGRCAEALPHLRAVAAALDGEASPDTRYKAELHRDIAACEAGR